MKNPTSHFRADTPNKAFSAELSFVKELFANFHLSMHIITSADDMPFTPLDLALRQLLFEDYDYTELNKKVFSLLKPRMLYCTQDFFLCHYFLFRLDEETTDYAVIGPYIPSLLTHDALVNAPFKFSIPLEFLPQLEKYYQEIACIPDSDQIFIVLLTLLQRIWGEFDRSSLVEIPNSSIENWGFAERMFRPQSPEEPFLSMKALEERYETERLLLEAVAAGQASRAQLILNQLMQRHMEPRVTDVLRQRKNYSTVLNTLLRKTAEIGGDVHPLHVDRISAKYAQKIEYCTTLRALEELNREMVHRYCLLVQNHSLKGYSLPIREVLIRIDADLRADLSLDAQAKLSNINASYLSTLFKKETGMTLTEYVNRKRVRHGVLLLNTTSLPLQTIAQHCGIPDVNYFIRIFKKYTGKTPKEYLTSVHNA